MNFQLNPARTSPILFPKQVIFQDFFKFENEKFDTVLLLMNGVGIASDLSGFKDFLKKCETLLNFNGQIIFDSSDVNYMFEKIQKPKHYYGEVQCCYEYNKQMAHWFQWLFIDQNTLRVIAEQEGWNCKIVYEDQNSQYLTVLTKS